MSTFSVLFRDSSAADGVQSRGAGWHSVAPDEEGFWTEVPDLVRGDLTRFHSTAVAVGLCVHDGRRLRQVAPPPLLPEEHHSDASRKLAIAAAGDWSTFWESRHRAVDLLWLITWVRSIDRGLLTKCACDCAETVLRFSGADRSRRAIRTTLRWLAGAATVASVAAASRGVYIGQADNLAAFASGSAASSVLQPTQTHAADAADYAAASAADHTLYNTHDEFVATYTSVAMSLAFLVRVVIPTWVVCLAIAEKGGRE